MHCIDKTPNPRAIVARHEDPIRTRDFPGPVVTALRVAQNKQQTSHSPEVGCNIKTQTNPSCSANTKPHIILPDPIPHNHTYIPPTPSTLDTTQPKQNNTHNTHPHKTRQWDTIANSLRGALQRCPHTTFTCYHGAENATDVPRALHSAQEQHHAI
jgi:hypothetical protein